VAGCNLRREPSSRQHSRLAYNALERELLTIEHLEANAVQPSIQIRDMLAKP
jgi:hypothetical protein